MSKFYKTIVTIEVLSDHPIDNYSLGEIIEESISGEFSMGNEKREVMKLTKAEMKKECLNQGSDPSFFGID